MPPARGRSAPKKDVLSANDRKMNHVASEKKRREAIRRRFDKIAAVVDGLSVEQSRSEALVLGKTVEMLEKLIEENKKLKELAEQHNIPLSDVTVKKTD